MTEPASVFLSLSLFRIAESKRKGIGNMSGREERYVPEMKDGGEDGHFAALQDEFSSTMQPPPSQALGKKGWFQVKVIVGGMIRKSRKDTERMFDISDFKWRRHRGREMVTSDQLMWKKRAPSSGPAVRRLERQRRGLAWKNTQRVVGLSSSRSCGTSLARW